MKSPPSFMDDDDDIFGPPRTYATGYCPPKYRPSMISPKYRQKEERRKVLKISVNKLKKIEDPEASLCRSVLINNTVKRLQKEARDEKLQKQQLNYPRCFDNENFINLKSEFMKNELKSYEEPADEIKTDELDGCFDDKITESAMNALNSLVDGDCNEDRKRAYDDIEDCDVQDVLSQFYMPPTPRMLTSIDDDEDAHENQPPAKRQKTEPSTTPLDSRLQEDDENNPLNQLINNNIPESDSRLRYTLETDTNTYTCGQASMFSEMQNNNVFHSLIASLET